MESTTHDNPYQSTTGSQNPLSTDLNSATGKAADAARKAGDQFYDAAAEKIGQAKEKVGEMYDRVNKNVNEQYDKAVYYGRENPGKMTLIGLGVGVGLGLLIGNRARDSRRGHGGIIGPVIHALSTLAMDLFT
jgi:ElaB protein